MQYTSCGICHTPDTRQPVSSSRRHRGPVGPACIDHTVSGGDRSRQVERRSSAPITFNTASIGIAGVGRTRRAMMAAGHTGEAQVEDSTTVEVEYATPDHKHQV